MQEKHKQYRVMYSLRLKCMIWAISQSLRRTEEGTYKLYLKTKNRRQLKIFPREIKREISICFIISKLFKKRILLKSRFENPGCTLFYLLITAFGGIPALIIEDLKANGGKVT